MQQMQNYEIKNQKIRTEFHKLLKERPELKSESLKFSWSNWGFGTEPFADGCRRLHQAGISYIEMCIRDRFSRALCFRKSCILSWKWTGNYAYLPETES